MKHNNTRLNQAQEDRVRHLTCHYTELAAAIYTVSLPQLPVRFDLPGRRAGMYRVSGGSRIIRYNPWLFARYFAANLAVTVPHEVAHYVADMIYGSKSIRPHGAEWKSVMAVFQADDSTTAGFDTEGIPARHYRRIDYVCACRTHALTRIRHNRIIRGARYYCRSCHRELRLA